MKLFFLELLIIFLISSCYNIECESCKHIKPPKKTLKEEAYIDSLKNRGFSNIRLFVPIIGLKGKGMDTYELEMDCPFNLTEDNADSIIMISDHIADELYSKVMEDSIIVECYDIFIRLNVRKSEIKKDQNILWQHYTKPSLEKWNRMRVVETAPGKFERQYW